MSQFTKSGFSKDFSCCSHWNECEMGKKEESCFYRNSDRETMLNCRAYQRNQRKAYGNMKDKALEEAFTLFDLLNLNK